MSNKELTKLALKVFSIYIMVHALLSIPQFFQAYISLNTGDARTGYFWLAILGVVALFLLLLLSVAIWKLSNSITLQVSNTVDKELAPLSESFAVSLLGIYLIFYGLSRLTIGAVGTYYTLIDNNPANDNLMQNVVYLLVYFIISIIGLTLILKSKGWAGLLNKLRVAGT